MRARHLACLTTAAALFAAPAFAQSSEESGADQGDIVVTGKADQPTKGEISKQARTVTRKQDLHDLPLARFEDRLCPGVIGLKPEFASLLIDRIRYNAKQADLRLGDDSKCSPNVVILFTEDGQAELSALEERRGYLFAPLPLHERRELLAETGPVRVWTTTQTKLLNGMPVPKRENLTDIPVARMHAAHSKIYFATREDISFVVVAFDREGVRGKTLVQLADYATMRALARTVPAEGDQAMGTILGLFDDGAMPPEEMTEFDRAYLASLYDGMPNLPGATKVLGVNRQLRLQQAAEEEAQP